MELRIRFTAAAAGSDPIDRPTDRTGKPLQSRWFDRFYVVSTRCGTSSRRGFVYIFPARKHQTDCHCQWLLIFPAIDLWPCGAEYIGVRHYSRLFFLFSFANENPFDRFPVGTHRKPEKTNVFARAEMSWEVTSSCTNYSARWCVNKFGRTTGTAR